MKIICEISSKIYCNFEENFEEFSVSYELNIGECLRKFRENFEGFFEKWTENTEVSL